MQNSLIPLLISLFLLPQPLSSVQAEVDSPVTSKSSGSYFSGNYISLFASLLGKNEKEIQAKIEKAFNQLFHGKNGTERVYYPVEPDMAYVMDILNNDVRSEGMSYGMMIAVQLDRKSEFDRIWKWAKTYMQHHTGIRKNYFAWHCTTAGAKLDQNAASDGEEWFVTALFFAAARWGNGEGIFNYKEEAQTILRTMIHKESEAGNDGTITNMFHKKEHQVVFVPSIEAAGFTDPSYHLPHFYELWGRWARSDNDFWCKAAATSRQFLKKAVHPATGLAPDYANFDGSPVDPWKGGHSDFRFDAWRVAMNVAVDHSWFGKDPWAVTQSNRLLSFFFSQGIGTYGNNFTLEGKRLSIDHSPGLVAMNAVACLAATHEKRKEFLEELWNAPVPSGPARYYDGLLYMMALLQVSGNFRIYHPNGVLVPACPDGSQ